MVHLGNDVTTSKADIFGKARRVNGSDQSTFHVLISGTARPVCPEVFQTQADLSGRWPVVIASAIYGAIRENLSAIRDRDGGLMILFVAQISHAYGIADGCAGNRIHQVISVMNRFAVHARNDVTRLQACLFGGAAPFPSLQNDSIRRTELLQYDGGGPLRFGETPPRRTAAYFPLACDAG